MRNWALKEVKRIRGKAEEMFEKLENWVRVAIKAENDAIFSVALVIKEAIENETKLRDELRVQLMDFEVDSGIANFIEQPPEPHPAREVRLPSRFPIESLNSIIGQIRASLATEASQLVDMSALFLLFQNIKKSSDSGFSDESQVPREWGALDLEKIQSLLKVMSDPSTG